MSLTGAKLKTAAVLARQASPVAETMRERIMCATAADALDCLVAHEDRIAALEARLIQLERGNRGA
jgi:hypothetical protein